MSKHAQYRQTNKLPRTTCVVRSPHHQVGIPTARSDGLRQVQVMMVIIVRTLDTGGKGRKEGDIDLFNVFAFHRSQTKRVA